MKLFAALLLGISLLAALGSTSAGRGTILLSAQATASPSASPSASPTGMPMPSAMPTATM